MRTQTLSLLLGFISCSSDKTPFYNILSVDGGGLRGIISAQCLDEMERYCWTYAQSQGYDIPKHYNKSGVLIEKMHLTNVFDMFAGTSAGSLITAGLAVPEENDPTEPRFFAEDVGNIFADNVNVMFEMNDQPGTWTQVVWLSVSILVFGTIFNFWCRSKY